MFCGKWNKASLVSFTLYEVLQDFDRKINYNFIKQKSFVCETWMCCTIDSF